MTITEYVSLKALNLEDLEQYNLINNYGFTFTINDFVRCNLRHVLNVYGVECDYWELWKNGSEKHFNTFEEALKAIKEMRS